MPFSLLRAGRTFLQESGDKSTEAKDTNRGESDTAGSGVSRAGGLGGTRAAGGAGITARVRGAGLGRGVRVGVVVVGRTGTSGRSGCGSTSLSASASDNGRVRRSTNDNGGGAANRDLEGSQAAGYVLHDVGDTFGKASRDGGDFGLGGDRRREGRLGSRYGRHAGDHTKGVGLCQVGGEGVGVWDGGGRAATGDGDFLRVIVSIWEMN